MNKKAQAQIITVVLIILLVLAAIIIVWQVIRSTVGETAEELEAQAGCIGVDLEIASITATSVSVKRNAGGPSGDISATIIVAGANVGTIANLGVLETLPSGLLTIASGDKVEVAALIGTTQCGVSDKETYTP